MLDSDLGLVEERGYEKAVRIQEWSEELEERNEDRQKVLKEIYLHLACAVRYHKEFLRVSVDRNLVDVWC